MKYFIVHGRDTRQILFNIQRVLHKSQKLYKIYDHVIFYPASIKIPNLQNLPRLASKQTQFIEYLNASEKKILLVFCTSQIFKKMSPYLGKHDVMIAQKNGENLRIQGIHFIGLQSSTQLKKLQKGNKSSIGKVLKQIQQMKKGQLAQFEQDNFKIIT